MIDMHTMMYWLPDNQDPDLEDDEPLILMMDQQDVENFVIAVDMDEVKRYHISSKEDFWILIGACYEAGPKQIMFADYLYMVVLLDYGVVYLCRGGMEMPEQALIIGTATDQYQLSDTNIRNLLSIAMGGYIDGWRASDWEILISLLEYKKDFIVRVKLNL